MCAPPASRRPTSLALGAPLRAWVARHRSTGHHPGATNLGAIWKHQNRRDAQVMISRTGFYRWYDIRRLSKKYSPWIFTRYSAVFTPKLIGYRQEMITVDRKPYRWLDQLEIFFENELLKWKLILKSQNALLDQKTRKERVSFKSIDSRNWVLYIGFSAQNLCFSVRKTFLWASFPSSLFGRFYFMHSLRSKILHRSIKKNHRFFFENEKS